MLGDSDRQLLIRAIRRNQCVLFLGAGFAAEATNRVGSTLPAGRKLGAEFWDWLGYRQDSGEYDPSVSPLDKIFDVAMRKRGPRAVLEFLQERLLVKSYPDWYRKVAYPYWLRIYTTNVDDLVEKIYEDTRTIRLQTLSAIASRYKSRDLALGSLQYAKLNGVLGSSLEELTFGVRQYAARSGEFDPWYDHFVRDYSTHPTILIGSEVNEPLFWQALVTRQGRNAAPAELRLRSFLVSPTISPVVVDSLADFNVVPVRATAREFFEYLHGEIGEYPKFEEIIVHVSPQIALYRDVLDTDKRDREALLAFLGAFERVSVPDRPASYKSMFLLGASPQWEDLALGLDAYRNITAKAQSRLELLIEDPTAVGPIVVTGHRGAGKSTLTMRLAMNLAAAGHLVFHGWGEDVPEPRDVARALERLSMRAVLVVDDAESIGRGRLEELVAELRKVPKPPLLVLALRANSLFLLEDGITGYEEVWVDELTPHDVDLVVGILEREHLLGAATGMQSAEIRRLFLENAQKQLLVALLTVTLGPEFERIMAKEYSELADPQLRVLYLSACLATEAGISLARDQFLSVAAMPPARVLSALQRELRLLLVSAPGPGDRLVARHPLIAETVVSKAPKQELADAYKRVLAVLAHDMDPDAKRGDGRRWFRLYKRLVNHDAIYRRFGRDMAEARAIYDSLTPLLATDSHFWLQYGSLELLKDGDLDSAAVYLASAETLNPSAWWVQNAKGHLRLVQGRAAKTYDEAFRLRQEGEEILKVLIEQRGEESAYPCHTLISHTLDWLDVWALEKSKKREELEALRTQVAEALEAHPADSKLKAVRDRVERDYLSTAT